MPERAARTDARRKASSSPRRRRGVRSGAGRRTLWSLRGSFLPGIAAGAARSRLRTPIPTPSDTKRRGPGTEGAPGGSRACSRGSDDLIPGLSVTFTRASHSPRNFVQSRRAGKQRVKEQRAQPRGEGRARADPSSPASTPGHTSEAPTRAWTPSAACVGSLGVCFGPDQRCSREITRLELSLLPYNAGGPSASWAPRDATMGEAIGKTRKNVLTALLQVSRPPQRCF